MLFEKESKKEPLIYQEFLLILDTGGRGRTDTSEETRF